MNMDVIAFELARMRQEELIAESALVRRIQRNRPSIRRSIGRRVIAVGERIAAEPSLKLARSR
ncbi:MAG: hypothetical protein ACRDIL_05365 [Candidatus Limnocylindrales bacterium]